LRGTMKVIIYRSQWTSHLQIEVRGRDKDWKGIGVCDRLICTFHGRGISTSKGGHWKEGGRSITAVSAVEEPKASLIVL
jgi:hypothetical protein